MTGPVEYPGWSMPVRKAEVKAYVDEMGYPWSFTVEVSKEWDT